MVSPCWLVRSMVSITAFPVCGYGTMTMLILLSLQLHLTCSVENHCNVYLASVDFHCPIGEAYDQFIGQLLIVYRTFYKIPHLHHGMLNHIFDKQFPPDWQFLLIV